MIKVFFTDDQKKLLSEELEKELVSGCNDRYNISFDSSTFLTKGNLSSDLLMTYVNRLITFSGTFLPFEKHYTFLNKLGEITISIGELELAKDIYKSIVNNFSAKPEFVSLNAYALLALANINARQANFDEAVSLAKKSLRLFQKENDSVGLTKAENLIGTVYAEQGRLRPAKIHFEKGLSILNTESDTSLVAMLEVNLGIIDNIQGKADESLTHFQRALLKYQQLKDNRRLAEVHHNIGVLYLKKDELTQASEEFDKSLELSVINRYLPTIAISYLGKAEVNIYTNDLELANAYLNKGMEISYQINDKLSIADGYKLKGIILRIERDYKNSENYFFSSLRLNEQFENKLNYAETAVELGIYYIEVETEDKAKQMLTEALEYYKKIKNKTEINKIKQLLGKL